MTRATGSLRQCSSSNVVTWTGYSGCAQIGDTEHNKVTSLGIRCGFLCSFHSLRNRKVYSNSRIQILRSTYCNVFAEHRKNAAPQGLIFNSTCKPFVTHRFQCLCSACIALVSVAVRLDDFHKEAMWKWNPEAVWKFWRREKRRAHTGIRTRDRQARSLVAVPITSWVSSPLPARVYYAARDHICKQCIYYKNFTII
jgi:hypothetical protein